jgi:hypothetical protein
MAPAQLFCQSGNRQEGEMSSIQKKVKPAHRGNGRNRFDKALLDAMQMQRPVDLFIAADLPWIRDSGFATVTILEVDTYAIRVKNEAGKESWIGKAFIVEARLG